METYTEKEIKHVKAQNFDKGWRYGLFVSSIFWIIVMAIIILIK